MYFVCVVLKLLLNYSEWLSENVILNQWPIVYWINGGSFVFSIHFVDVLILRYQDFEVSPYSLNIFFFSALWWYRQKMKQQDWFIWNTYILKPIFWLNFNPEPSPFYNLPVLPKMASSQMPDASVSASAAKLDWHDETVSWILETFFFLKNEKRFFKWLMLQDVVCVEMNQHIM